MITFNFPDSMSPAEIEHLLTEWLWAQEVFDLDDPDEIDLMTAEQIERFMIKTFAVTLH